MTARISPQVHTMDDFFADAAAGTLPALTWIHPREVHPATSTLTIARDGVLLSTFPHMGTASSVAGRQRFAGQARRPVT